MHEPTIEMTMQPTDTASNYNALEDYPGDQSTRDLRRSPRSDYPYGQYIAPWYGGDGPAEDDFFAVACVDLSRSGFSFCLENAPEFGQLVVALGPPDAPSYVTAEVVQVREIDRAGVTAYRVGCRFTERWPE